MFNVSPVSADVSTSRRKFFWPPMKLVKAGKRAFWLLSSHDVCRSLALSERQDPVVGVVNQVGPTL